MPGFALPTALLRILACPVCLQPVEPGSNGSSEHAWLHCRACGRHYPVQDGIPVMLANRATAEPPA